MKKNKKMKTIYALKRKNYLKVLTAKRKKACLKYWFAKANLCRNIKKIKIKKLIWNINYLNKLNFIKKNWLRIQPMLSKALKIKLITFIIRKINFTIRSTIWIRNNFQLIICKKNKFHNPIKIKKDLIRLLTSWRRLKIIFLILKLSKILVKVSILQFQVKSPK